MAVVTREELILTGVRGLLEELLGEKYEAALAKDALLGGRTLWKQIEKIEKGIGQKVLPERAESAAWVVEAVRDFLRQPVRGIGGAFRLAAQAWGRGCG